MEVPSFLSPFVDGDAPKRLFQGLAVGVIGTLVIGFGWGGWSLGSTVEQKVETARRTAMVAALAPICADRFERAAKADKDLVVKLTAVSSWQRDDHLMKAGWATFPGGVENQTGMWRTLAPTCSTLPSNSSRPTAPSPKHNSPLPAIRVGFFTSDRLERRPAGKELGRDNSRAAMKIK